MSFNELDMLPENRLMELARVATELGKEGQGGPTAPVVEHPAHPVVLEPYDNGVDSSPEEDEIPVVVEDAHAVSDEIPVVVEDATGNNFCPHGFIDFNGMVEVSRKRGLTSTQATAFLDQANATREHYKIYLRKLGPRAWVGKRPGSMRYHVRSKSWKQLTTHRNINERGEEEFSYSWQTINRLPAGSAAIANQRRLKAIKIARKMRTLIRAYKTNHESFYSDIDGWKPMKTLAVE
jgi:hypothetical protein